MRERSDGGEGMRERNKEREGREREIERQIKGRGSV